MIHSSAPSFPSSTRTASRALRSLLCALAISLACTTASADGSGQASKADSEAEAVQPQVNINTATAEELLALPGVGPAKAEAILKTRARIKRFKRVAGIMRVPGIGRKTFARLRPRLTVGSNKAAQKPKN